MLKQLSFAGLALAISASALVPLSSASAQDYRNDYRGGRHYDRDYRGYDQRGYDQRGYGYRDNRGGYYRQNAYQRRYYRNDRCSDGTAGTIIGAIAGGLLGNSVAGRGDRGAGTILGGAAGALAGRAIDRGGCRR